MVFAACALLALVAIVYVVYVQPRATPVAASDPERDYLQEKKAVLYENLRDLNLEYRMGKLSDEDYQRIKHQYQFEIAGVMAQIEDHQALRVAGKSPAAAHAAAPRATSPPRGEQICPRCGTANSPRN